MAGRETADNGRGRLTASVEEAVAACLTVLRRTPSAVVTDIDGTISPIVDRPEQAEQAAGLADEAFSRAVEARAHSIHGAMQVDSAPALFPLKAALAERFAARRTVLVGEAAHLFPPIGAQGLNLGFRDVAALKRVLARHRGDPGAPAALEAYHSARQADVRSRTLAVDLLNRSLLTDFLPVQAARGIGLALASSVPLLRRALRQQGLASGRPAMRHG